MTESAESRRARAAALQSELIAGFKPSRVAQARRAATGPVLEGASPAVLAALAELDLHGRRYGLSPGNRTALRRMGCRTVADAAELDYGRCVDWLGFREAEAVRVRVAEIAREAEAGHPEPGVSRMLPDPAPDVLAWMAERPIEDVAGRGIPMKVAKALRGAGHETLSALATEEADSIGDIHGIADATVSALSARLAGIAAEGPAGRRRRPVADDAEWDAAGPA